MELSVDQEAALAGLSEFLEAPYVNQQYRTLHGLAGTGKTFLLARLAALYPGLTLTAFTGKAASVLRKRVGVPVSTLHSVIYNFAGHVEDEEEPGKRNPIFSPKGDPLPGRVILIDEVSMVGERIAKDLLDTGARVICCGDPGQLPPVRDRQFFDRADYRLMVVHRQALDSPIVRQAHRVRKGEMYGPDTDGFRVLPSASTDELLGHDAILCWRNSTRRRLNRKVRALRGFPVGELVAGELVMCLKNDKYLGVYNGAIYTVVERRGDELYLTDGEGHAIAVPTATVELIDSDFDERRYEEGLLAFSPAYAMTVHKSQGSEYPSILLFDEAERDWCPFMYTGITRAVERCTVIKWRD